MLLVAVSKNTIPREHTLPWEATCWVHTVCLSSSLPKINSNRCKPFSLMLMQQSNNNTLRCCHLFVLSQSFGLMELLWLKVADHASSADISFCFQCIALVYQIQAVLYSVQVGCTSHAHAGVLLVGLPWGGVLFLVSHPARCVSAKSSHCRGKKIMYALIE